MKSVMKFVGHHKILCAWVLSSVLLAIYLIVPFTRGGIGTDEWCVYAVAYSICFLLCSVFFWVGSRRNEFVCFFWCATYEYTFWGKAKSYFVNFVRDHRRISLWWGLRIALFLFGLFNLDWKWDSELWYGTLALSLLPGFFFYVHWLCVGGRAKKYTSDIDLSLDQREDEMTAKKDKESLSQQLPDCICPRCGNVYNIKSTTAVTLKGMFHGLKMAVFLLILGGVLCVLSFSLFSIVGALFVGIIVVIALLVWYVKSANNYGEEAMIDVLSCPVCGAMEPVPYGSPRGKELAEQFKWKDVFQPAAQKEETMKPENVARSNGTPVSFPDSHVGQSKVSPVSITEDPDLKKGGGDVKRRLADLEALRKDGIITEAEYREQRQKIISSI